MDATDCFCICAHSLNAKVAQTGLEGALAFGPVMLSSGVT